MKKMILGSLALMAAVAFTSCDKTASSAAPTAIDSLSSAYGNYVGAMLYSDLSNMGKGDKADKQEFVRGMQLVFAAPQEENIRMGMQVAMRMLAEMDQLEQQGIKVDRVAVMNSFKDVFLSNDMNMDQMANYEMDFRDLYQRAAAEAEAAKNAEKESEPETVQNGMIGQAYVDNLKANDPDVKTTDSGLSYKIEEPGTGDKPAETSTVKVHYTGRHIDGSVFDSSVQRGEPATFNLQGVVPGFREGIMQLAKGGKATLYIPGKLAYGNNGTPDGSIKPNETLVFDVELLEVLPE